MTAKVFITDYITDPHFEKEVLGDLLSDTPHEAIESLIVWHEHIDAAYMSKFPNLKGIIRYGVGIDNVDIAYAGQHNIKVCNTPDYGIEEVSDTAIAMIMNAVRCVSQHDTLCRQYRKTWETNIIPSVRRTSELKLGVLGAGLIGCSILLKARALGFQTRFYDPFTQRGTDKLLNAEHIDDLDDFLQSCDVLSFNAPLTKDTIGMVNESFISKMKPGSVFINTARGKIISDLDVFYTPLKEKHLSHVGLDVIPDEPPKDGKLITAWRNNESWLEGRFILNPHVSYYSQEAYKEMRHKAAKNALRIINNETPHNLVNRQYLPN